MTKKNQGPHKDPTNKEIMAKLSLILLKVKALEKQGSDRAAMKKVTAELTKDADTLGSEISG
jgi:hypothetical protein